MLLRGLVAVLVCAPVPAAQEAIEGRSPRQSRAAARDELRERAQRVREQNLPPSAMGLALSRGVDGRGVAEVFVRAAPGGEDEPVALGARIGVRAGEWLTAAGPFDALRLITRLPGVRGVELARMVQTCTSTMTEVGAAGLRRCVDRDEFSGATGQGTIFGIVDTGIDYPHRGFIDDVTGRSRILYRWDQAPPLGVRTRTRGRSWGSTSTTGASGAKVNSARTDVSLKETATHMARTWLASRSGWLGSEARRAAVRLRRRGSGGGPDRGQDARNILVGCRASRISSREDRSCVAPQW